MKNIKLFILESSKEDMIEDMASDLAEWWESHCEERFYDSHSEFIKDMKAMIKKQNDQLVKKAFDYLIDECEWDEKDVNKFKDRLIYVLAQWANDELE